VEFPKSTLKKQAVMSEVASKTMKFNG